MKFEILLKMLFLFLSRRRLTASYIAEQCGISRRTVFRYIESFSLAGVPIVSEPGREGGYYIAETYRLSSGFLTAKEFEATVSTLSSYNEQFGSPELTSVIDKLRALSRLDCNVEDMYMGHFIIDGSSWTGSDTMHATVSFFARAIESRDRVGFVYRDRFGGETERTVDPYYVVLKEGAWYVYAFCHLREDFRVFKIARIRYANATGEKFERREIARSDLGLEKFFQSLPTELIEFECDPAGKNELEEWLGVDRVTENRDGTACASAYFPVDKHLVSKILSFGGTVRVVSPEKLKKEVASAARSVLASIK